VFGFFLTAIFTLLSAFSANVLRNGYITMNADAISVVCVARYSSWRRVLLKTKIFFHLFVRLLEIFQQS